MKPTRIVPRNKGALPAGQLVDRVPQLLIWAAMILVAVLAALGVDILRESRSKVAVAQALSHAPLSSSLSPAGPTTLPSLEPTTAAPAASPAAAAVTPPPCVPPNDWGIHIVQEGNTLSSLAERYGSDVDTLMLVNCLNTDTIFLGQRLYVPGILTPVLPATTLLGTPTSAGRATVEPLPTGVRATPPGPLPKANIPNIYLNIVLLGSDRRPDSGAWRTDSMIVVSVDQRNQEVRLLSLPRDLWVYIPNHGYNRINTADLWGELAHEGDGPEWVKRTIYENLGIPIHYYVRVDFNGFIKIIDSLGGVDINVEEALPDVRIEAGPQHMNGKEALRYARSRYTTSDFDRGRRQRILLTALWEQALTLDVVPRLPQLWVSMADTFMTDLPLSEVINLAYLGTKVKREDIHSAGFDRAMVENWTTPEGAAVLLPREERIQAMLEDFYAPLPAAQVATDNPVIVEVLNGCQGEEAEEMAASRLRAEGYKVNRTGSAGRQDYPQTSIVVYKGELAIGQAIAGVLGVPATAATQASDSDEEPDVRVILGADYGQCQP